MAYKKVNGCTHSPSIQQILVIVIYLIIVVLHSVYILFGVINTEKHILYFMLAMHYLLLLFIIYDYTWITFHDPVDRIISNQDLIQDYVIEELEDCRHCGKRQIGSYHCRKCNRCTEDFDHHCKFLNNCIGKRNYEQFIRLLSLNIVFLFNLIGQAVWVFVLALKNEGISSAIPNSFYLIVAVLTLSAIILILITILLLFHCYISCCQGLTTLEYVLQQKNPQQEVKKQNSKGQHYETERKIQQTNPS